MPTFVLNRTHTLRTTFGHIINFHKNEPTHVPPECVKDAVAIGAQPTEGEIDVIGEAKEDVVLSATERKELLNKAFTRLEVRQERGDFTAQGVPNLRVLEGMTGFSVQTKERDEAWQAYRDAAMQPSD
jgi:hypothetical protein